MSLAADQQRSLAYDTTPLYLAGWRVATEPGGARLRFIDTFANRNEDFGLHASEARAWEIAALLSKPGKTISYTSSIA